MKKDKDLFYEYNGLVFKIFFRHERERIHPRIEEPRAATTLCITSPTGLINIEQTFYCRGDRPLPSYEFRRQQAIGKMKPFLPRAEYIALRRAYFLRPKKTRAARRQTRMFGQELKRLILNADTDPVVRTYAATLKHEMERIPHAKTQKHPV